jgi:hypothetical protein
MFPLYWQRQGLPVCGRFVWDHTNGLLQPRSSLRAVVESAIIMDVDVVVGAPVQAAIASRNDT